MSKVNLVDVQTGYRVTSVINDNNQRIEDALENTLSRDGTTPNAMKTPLDMDGHKVLNVSPGTVASDAATKGQLDGFAANLPSSAIDQIATKVAAILNAGGGGVTPPVGYTNPPAPTTLTTSGVTYANVTLTWTMSAITNAEGYYVYRNGAQIAKVRNPATLTYSDTTVAPLITYTYAVSSFNETYDFESARTATAAIQTPANTTATAPGTPTNVVVVESIPKVANVTWTYTSTAPTDAFIITRNGADLDFVGPNNRSYIDNAVAYGATYTYQVVAYNAQAGKGTPSNIAGITIASANNVTPITAPTSLAATAQSPTTVLVTWAYSLNVHQGFILYYGSAFGGSGSVTLAKADRSYLLTGLTPGTTISIQVSAYGTVSGTYTEAITTAVPVTTPTATATIEKPIVTVAATGNTSIDINWSQPGTVRAAEYVVRRAGVVAIATTGANVRSYTDTNLTPGTVYSYTVEAREVIGGGNGNNNVSDTVSTTTLGTVPTPTPFVFSYGPLPNGRQNEAYTGPAATFSGGVPPYSVTITGVPAGLSYAATDGSLSGTPAAGAVGPNSLTVTGRDSSPTPQTDTSGEPLFIYAAYMSLSYTSFPSAVNGVAYSTTSRINVVGGQAPFTLGTVTNKPSWMTCTLSGTTIAITSNTNPSGGATTFTLGFTVTDNQGSVATLSLPFVVLSSAGATAPAQTGTFPNITFQSGAGIQYVVYDLDDSAAAYYFSSSNTFTVSFSDGGNPIPGVSAVVDQSTKQITIAYNDIAPVATTITTTTNTFVCSYTDVTPPAGTAADAAWDRLSTAAGVDYRERFDTYASVLNGIKPSQRVANPHYAWDTTTFNSGVGSYRSSITGPQKVRNLSTTNPSPDSNPQPWSVKFPNLALKNPGDEFYIQIVFKPSAFMLNHYFNADYPTGQKIMQPGSSGNDWAFGGSSHIGTVINQRMQGFIGCYVGASGQSQSWSSGGGGTISSFPEDGQSYHYHNMVDNGGANSTNTEKLARYGPLGNILETSQSVVAADPTTQRTDVPNSTAATSSIALSSSAWNVIVFRAKVGPGGGITRDNITQIWAAQWGNQPKAVIGRTDVNFRLDRNNPPDGVQVLAYLSGVVEDLNRPTGYHYYDWIIASSQPIKFPNILYNGTSQLDYSLPNIL